jgi:hypothetical protein
MRIIKKVNTSEATSPKRQFELTIPNNENYELEGHTFDILGNY